MKILRKKPGVVILPVLIISVIFFSLLLLLLDQKKSNNELILEYRASRVISLLVNLYEDTGDIDPADVDENILGFGIYDFNFEALTRFGTAPERLPELTGRNPEKVAATNRSVEIIRLPRTGPVLNPMMGRSRGRRTEPMQQTMPMMQERAEHGIYMEYGNSSYTSEFRLLVLLTVFFTGAFGIAFLVIFKLYSQNRKLIIKSEHDKQLIQLGEAARTLAHEIRNPLGTLKLQRDLLKKKLPDGYDSNLEVIDRELKRLNLLVERVGEFLRNPVGTMECIDLADFFQQLYGSRESVKINYLKPGSRVYFDRERLRTVIDNIINNAVEAGGTAFVEIGPSSVMIRDKGPGFSDEALERLFDPFFTTKNSGTGLGMSIVKRLVETAGGKVIVKNMKEGGASVSVEFEETDESTCS